MTDGTRSELIAALRGEAEESRRLAGSFQDAPSVKDLKAYASELEAEAMRAQGERKLSLKSARDSLASIALNHPGPSMQAVQKNR